MKQKKPRFCQGCGTNLQNKKVGEKFRSLVICLNCHFSGYAAFDKGGNTILYPEKDWRKNG